MTTVFLSVGSNIEPEKNIVEALRQLSTQVKVISISTVYLTEPLEHGSQPKYYNCVVKIETDVEPEKLKFDVLREIERRLGRKRTRDKYAPRTIDLDIIAYGNLQLATKELVLPDPQIQQRPFLAIPLCEIEPDLVLPGFDRPMKKIAENFKSDKMIALKEFTSTLRNSLKTSRM